MANMNKAQLAELERYLRTGEYDTLFLPWPGGSVIERAQRGSEALVNALLAEVTARVAAVDKIDDLPIPCDALTEFSQAKALPMVTGLFPRKERDTVSA